MIDQQSIRRSGYTKPVNYAGYKVHDVTQHRFDGNLSPRGNRLASEVTKARKVNVTGARPLYKRETNEELFGPGYADYKKLHGSI